MGDETTTLINEKVLPAINNVSNDLKILSHDFVSLKSVTNEALHELKCDVDDLHTAIYGNGKGGSEPGLRSDIRMMQKWIEDRSTIERVFVAAVVTGLTAQFIALIFIAIKTFGLP